MAIRTLRLEHDPLLRKTSKPVREMSERMQTLIQDMEETLKAQEGVGLAAPQVGVLRRLFLTDYEGVCKVYINPEILEEDGVDYMVEGCLSLPNQVGLVRRPEKIRIRALDRQMQPFETELSGFEARIFCHEFDHLNGVLYKDRAKIMNDEVYEKMEDDADWEAYIASCYQQEEA